MNNIKENKKELEHLLLNKIINLKEYKKTFSQAIKALRSTSNDIVKQSLEDVRNTISNHGQARALKEEEKNERLRIRKALNVRYEQQNALDFISSCDDVYFEKTKRAKRQHIIMTSKFNIENTNKRKLSNKIVFDIGKFIRNYFLPESSITNIGVYILTATGWTTVTKKGYFTVQELLDWYKETVEKVDAEYRCYGLEISYDAGNNSL